jgi:sigma-70-like protein
VSNEHGESGTRDFDATVGPWIEPGYRLAVAMLRDPDEARDAVQEATVKAWLSIDRLRDSGQARAWFLAIVANHCRSMPHLDAGQCDGSGTVSWTQAGCDGIRQSATGRARTCSNTWPGRTTTRCS